MTEKKVPHDDFGAGFAAGYQAIKGRRSVIPAVPPLTESTVNSSRFLRGIKAGMARAGIEVTLA